MLYGVVRLMAPPYTLKLRLTAIPTDNRSVLLQQMHTPPSERGSGDGYDARPISLTDTVYVNFPCPPSISGLHYASLARDRLSHLLTTNVPVK